MKKRVWAGVDVVFQRFDALQEFLDGRRRRLALSRILDPNLAER